MHSNFITPPDYVETILILNATEQQINELGQAVHDGDQIYHVYFYNADTMNNPVWFDKISAKADTVLDAKLTNLVDYFNK